MNNGERIGRERMANRTGPEAEDVTAFAPATVGNLNCGFDVFGLALEQPGDQVTARVTGRPGVRMGSIAGDGGRLPRDPRLNGAGAAAAVVAVDHLLGTDAPAEVLLRAALTAEKVSSGGHADNLAPALFGGIVLVRDSPVRPLVRLPVPEGLSVALLHPGMEVATRDARSRLDPSVPLATAVTQWGNTAAFVAALHTGDWELMADALVDKVAEPYRAPQIPGFQAVGHAARAAGAVGYGISGAGPSLFALCRSLDEARPVGDAMVAAFREAASLPATLYLSGVSMRGARVLGVERAGEASAS